MRESENALWTKTRRRKAANRRRTERSESAAEPPAPPRRFPHKRCGKNSAPTPVVFPQASTLSPCTIFRARRTPCRAVFCSPLLRPAGRKVSRPPRPPLRRFSHNRCGKNSVRPAAPLRGGKSPRAAPRFCGRLLEKNKRGKTPRPNRLAEQKTALLCAFLPFSLFCKAFSKFS